jgi:TonB-linked SusC/RagA family outer membrane protein
MCGALLAFLSLGVMYADDGGAPIVQQQRSVRGTVVDEKGEPVIGANIVIKGTPGSGTISDVDGKFSLNVQSGATLTVSCIGFKTQDVAVGNETSLKITMREDAELLDEVVVVGYGTQKSVNLTGAVAQVSSKTIENRSVTNISQALQGQVANLNITSSSGGAPGSTPNINIRGYTGLGTPASPLIVIDGIQGGDINTINMNDVESVSVLKDAASAAIYGSSAPYGVILITTKKGQKGQKATITYNNNIGFAQPVNLPKMANSLTFVEEYNKAAANASMNPVFSEADIQRLKDYQSGALKDQTIKNPTEGADGWLRGHANNDWFKIFFKDNSFRQQHNIGVSGGGERSGYFVGLGYNQQDGMYRYGDDWQKKYSIRANLTAELTKWMSFNFRGSFIKNEIDRPAIYSNLTGWTDNYMLYIGNQWPVYPVFYPNGEYNTMIVLQRESGRYKKIDDNAVLTGEFVLRPAKGWDITANYTYDVLYTHLSNHIKTIYTTRPSGAKALVGASSPNSLERRQNWNQHHAVNLFSSYEKEISGHSFKALVGYTQELYNNMDSWASASELYSDAVPSLSLAYGSNRNVGDGASQLAIRGGFGRINYNYNEKYLLELNGRYDGTSRFLKDVRHKFYPGISAGWVVSRESFWTPLESAVNFLKLRGSYGSLGDQSAVGGYYPFYPSLGVGTPSSANYLFSTGRESFVSNPGLVNPYLTWVTATTLDFGADFGFFNNRLTVSYDRYRRQAVDYVGPAAALPSILGTSAPATNNAEIETNGWELTLGWRDHINDFSYEVKGVLSDYTGKIIRYPNPNKINSTWYDGMSMGEIWGYETVGLFQNEAEIAAAADQSKISANKWVPGDVHYKDLNGDGIISWGDNTVDNPGDRKVIGNSTPRYSYGLNLNASWKGFDLTLFFQGVGKRDIAFTNDSYVPNSYIFGIVGDLWQSCVFEQHLDRWSETNPDGYLPRAYMNIDQMKKNTQVQTRYLLDGSYLRVKNLQLGYNLPASLIKKIEFEKVRLFVNVENLATFTNLMKVMDPEFNSGDWQTGAKAYPLQRTWAFGVNVTF